MGIKNRISFEEYNPEKVANVAYLIYKDAPLCNDFEPGAEKTIVLRNKQTGKLERIKYKLSGSVSLTGTDRYLWYWGRVIPECGMDLVFYFNLKGEIEDVKAIYSAPSLDIKEYNRIYSNLGGCAADVTKYY